MAVRPGSGGAWVLPWTRRSSLFPQPSTPGRASPGHATQSRVTALKNRRFWRTELIYRPVTSAPVGHLRWTRRRIAAQEPDNQGHEKNDGQQWNDHQAEN